MLNEDLFVGTISTLLGILSLLAAIFNWDKCYELVKVRWILAFVGRTGARVFYAVLGISLIVLGCVIAWGYC